MGPSSGVKSWKCQCSLCTFIIIASSKPIHEEDKSRLNSGNACYYPVQSLSSSRLLSRNVNVKIYKTTFLPAVLYGCETWALTLREEHRRRVFKNRVLRRIFGLKRDKVTGEWGKLQNEELHNLYSSPDISSRSSQGEWGGCSGLVLRYILPRRLHGGTEENNEKTQYNLSTGRDLKPRPPKYETGVLTTRPRCVVCSDVTDVSNCNINILSLQATA
jgi:hypothetical protein